MEPTVYKTSSDFRSVHDVIRLIVRAEGLWVDSFIYLGANLETLSGEICTLAAGCRSEAINNETNFHLVSSDTESVGVLG